MRYEDALIAAPVRIAADHDLTGEVLRGVGHEPVLADRDHDVVGFEEEAVQVGAIDSGSPPVDRDGGRDRLDGRSEEAVHFGHFLERSSARGQEEAGLFPRPVSGQQRGVLGLAGHDDHARDERGHVTCLRARVGWRASPSRPGAPSGSRLPRRPGPR